MKELISVDKTADPVMKALQSMACCSYRSWKGVIGEVRNFLRDRNWE